MARMGFVARLTGVVNGASIRLSGKGHIDPALGLTDGTYKLDETPTDLDPMLLSAFLINGYPNATARIDEAINLFEGRSFEYRRELKLRDGGKIVQRASVRLGQKGLESRFHLTGWARVPTLAEVEPVVESWEPHGPGGIRGHFTIGWKTSDGLLIVGDAHSTYQVETDDALAGIVHRFIIMNTVVSRDRSTMREIQTEGLFRSLPWNLWIRDEAAARKLQGEFNAAAI